MTRWATFGRGKKAHIVVDCSCGSCKCWFKACGGTECHDRPKYYVPGKDAKPDTVKCKKCLAIEKKRKESERK